MREVTKNTEDVYPQAKEHHKWARWLSPNGKKERWYFWRLYLFMKKKILPSIFFIGLKISLERNVDR